jgi:hypothetical protein
VFTAVDRLVRLATKVFLSNLPLGSLLIIGLFLLEIVYADVPDQPTEVSKIEFKILGKITKKERVDGWNKS